MKHKKNGAAPQRETGRYRHADDFSVFLIQVPADATTDIRVKPLG